MVFVPHHNLTSLQPYILVNRTISPNMECIASSHNPLLQWIWRTRLSCSWLGNTITFMKGFSRAKKLSSKPLFSEYYMYIQILIKLYKTNLSKTDNLWLTICCGPWIAASWQYSLICWRIFLQTLTTLFMMAWKKGEHLKNCLCNK